MRGMTADIRKHLQGVNGAEDKLRKYTWCLLSLLENSEVLSLFAALPFMAQHGIHPDSVLREQQRILAEIIEEGQRSGEIRPNIDINLLSKIYFGGIERIAFSQIKSDIYRPLTNKVDEYTDLIFRSIKIGAIDVPMAKYLIFNNFLTQIQVIFGIRFSDFSKISGTLGSRSTIGTFNSLN